MKIRRWFSLSAMLLLTAMLLAGCGSSGTGKTNPDSDSPADGSSARQTVPDVDLSSMSDTMAYAGVIDIASEPEKYLKKTVRISGLFDMFLDEQTGNVYYACLIADATACCLQGLEFVPKASFSFPEDFPDVGKQITVIGTFSTYVENGIEYCTLKDAEIL